MVPGLDAARERQDGLDALREARGDDAHRIALLLHELGRSAVGSEFVRERLLERCVAQQCGGKPYARDAGGLADLDERRHLERAPGPARSGERPGARAFRNRETRGDDTGRLQELAAIHASPPFVTVARNLLLGPGTIQAK